MKIKEVMDIKAFFVITENPKNVYVRYGKGNWCVKVGETDEQVGESESEKLDKLFKEWYFENVVISM